MEVALRARPLHQRPLDRKGLVALTTSTGGHT